MTEEQQPEKIWLPPTPLEVNVQRMAWTLFLEWWQPDLFGLLFFSHGLSPNTGAFST